MLQQKSRKSWQTSCSTRYVSDLIFALPLCQLLHHPLPCSTDRRCVFVIPLCRPDISGGWGASLFWTRNCGFLCKHLTLLIFLIQGTDAIGKLCVLMLVQKSKVRILHKSGLRLWDCLNVTIFTLISSQELQVRENSKRVTSTHFCHYFPWSCLIKEKRNTIFQICVGLAVCQLHTGVCALRALWKNTNGCKHGLHPYGLLLYNC